jgi:hypothetical protein
MTDTEAPSPADPLLTQQVWYKRKSAWISAAAGVALVAVVLAIVAVIGHRTDLQSAATACKIDKSQFAEVADGGNTLTLDGASEAGGDGLTVTKLGCVLHELKATTAVVTQMEGTTSLQGRQGGSWGDVHATWTYHPDNGLDMILTHK